MGAVDSPAEVDLRDDASPRGLDLRLARLDRAHPSSPRYADRTVPDGGRDSGEIRPFTDAEHGKHVADVRDRLAAAHSGRLDTPMGHTLDRGQEIWTDRRGEAHDALLAELYERAESVPCEHKAVVAGGLAGAGKTTVLREFAGIDLAGYLVINPDDIKGEMARRGLAPDIDGLTPMEATDLVHEEASHIAKRLARIAQADGRNVIWDVTMSKADSTESRIKALRAGGYTQVDGVFVDIPVDVAISRADARHREGHDAYLAGAGLGGRIVSPEMVRAQADSTWGSVNRRNFEQVKHLFDSWSRYDNSVDGRPPVRVATSADAPHDGRERICE